MERAARDHDRWSRWLLDRRHGGDERQLAELARAIASGDAIRRSAVAYLAARKAR